jgi:hypothetical protein
MSYYNHIRLTNTDETTILDAWEEGGTTPILEAETPGCGCCAERVELTPAQLMEERERLLALADEYLEMLTTYNLRLDKTPLSGELPDDNDNIKGLIRQGR